VTRRRFLAPRRPAVPPAAVMLAAALLAVAAAWGPSAPAAAATLAVAPLSDRQGDPEAAEAADAALHDALAAEHALVDPAALRDVLRRGRLRVLDDALPEELREVAAATGAERILSFTLHQTSRLETPTLALSGRAYDGATGELLWAGFEAASGLDGRRLLGLGVVGDMAVLADRAARRLVADFLDGRRAGARPAAAGLGTVALVPFGSVTEAAGTNAAETLTEVTRATFHRHGGRLVSPSRVAEVLRRRGWSAWGGVDDATRLALAEQLGVRWVLTGGVEEYESAGGAGEPEPRVAVALRLLDAETGGIAWMGGREGSGWDGQGPFHAGRIYSRGDLAEELISTLVRRLLRERAGEPQ
jgi:TolB-like protein